MDAFKQGFLEGQQKAIEEMSKVPHCDECGGQAHGSISHDLGFDAGVDACVQLIEEGHFKGNNALTNHNKQWLLRQLKALKKK